MEMDQNLPGQAAEEETGKKGKDRKRFVPLVAAVILLVVGGILNGLLIYATRGDLLFMLGRLDPQIMVRTTYLMWVVGLVALPGSVAYARGVNKKSIEIAIVAVTIVLSLGCVFVVAKDEMLVVRAVVSGFDYYTDGKHSVVVMNANTPSGTNLQHFYIRESRFYYYWYSAGTENAVIEWREDGAYIVQGGEDCLRLDYGLFYEE